MARKYLIETFGCQMNVHDSERMAGLLEAAGYEATDEPAEADLLVLNTCSVRERAEEKVFSRVGELKADSTARGRDPIVAVTGCLAQQEGAALFGRSAFIDVVVGTQAEKRLPALVADAVREGRPQVDINPYDDVSFPLGVARRQDPVKAFVTIIEGCNDHCAFCVVPRTRGKERMRPVEAVLDEVREAAATGHREIHLLGQIVNHYQAPDRPSCDFAALLELVNEVPGVARIRFASPHPRHVTDRLIEAVASLPHVCKHLHLPVQSGSNRILQTMRRRHTREEYLDLVGRLRSRVSGIQLSTDIIIGFPGEGDSDFRDTLSLVGEVGYSAMFSFKYSERPNTLASKRMADDVAEEVKTERLMELQERQREIQLRLNEAKIGTRAGVLVDGVSRRHLTDLTGRTSGNTVVNFPGDAGLLGRVVAVEVTHAGPNSLRGRVAADQLP